MKTAIDANILIRNLVHDGHSEKAGNLIAKHEKKDIYVCSLVVFEAHFALTRSYNFSNDIFLDALEDLLKIEQLAFEHETALRQAIIKARKGCPFKDAFIGEVSAAKNLKTLTFDKGLKSNSNFQVL